MNFQELKEFINEIDADFDDETDVIIEDPESGLWFHLDSVYAGDDGELVVEMGEPY